MPFLPAIVALAPVVPHLVAVRTDKPPVLDGRLDEPVWAKAAASDTFTQKSPVDGRPPGDRTVVRVLYDDENVYVGITCFQKVPVVARLTRRDRLVEADTVSVMLDTRNDGKSAFEFAVNAAGVRTDILHFNDTDTNADWDENWESQVAITTEGWSAEIRIPLRVLRFPTRPVQSWGMQVRRYVSARQELDEWSHIPRDAAGEVSRYGRLDDLRGLKAMTPIELRPFVVGSIRHHDPGGTALARGWAPGFSAGLDLKWHVSQALTLDATILPDFGQVEADQVILNLTTYELYYPEKRPFFLEGVDMFSTPIQLLYTRRIGRAPDAPALVSSAEQLVDEPVPSTIYAAAKLTGELGGRWSVGELVAVTGRQTVAVQTANGQRVDRPADPLTAYEVLRLKRDIGEKSYVGLMLTTTTRLESTSAYPAVPGGPPTVLCPDGSSAAPGARCYHDAYVAAVDGRWRSESGDYVITAQAMASMMKNGPARTLPDGTVIKSGDVGPGASVRAAKEGGKGVVASAQYDVFGKLADYNDLGFMQRQNMVNGQIYVEYRTLQPKGETLETHTALYFSERDNLSFQNQARSFELQNYTRFKNFWGLYTGLHLRPAHFDDREVGDGAALQRAGLFGAEAWMGTDSRKRVYAEIWSQAHYITNGFTYQGNGLLSIKALPQWDIDLLPAWVYTTGEPRYFATQGSTYLFGNQRAQSLSLILRSTYTFMPRLTLQAYMQAIVEAEHFSSYTAFPAQGAGTAVRLADLRPYKGVVAANPDYASGTLNASVVLRWEYRLGSIAYLVYTHAQSRTVTPAFTDPAGFDFSQIKPQPAEDEWLLKVSYWWG